MRVTLRDIAKATGLTVNTVSHALHDKDDISETTKEKVRRAAEELGYIRNIGAAALRNGKSKVIAIVYDNLLNPYYSIMMHYLDNSLTRHGYSFLTFVEKSGDKISKDMVTRLIQYNLDGIISFLELSDEAIKFYQAKANLPILLIGRNMPHDFIDCIYTGDKKGGRLAAEYLTARGYKKIVYVADTLEISCAAERFEGCREALAERGLKEDLILAQGAPYKKEIIKKISGGCDAFICFNDMMAFEVMDTLTKLGRTDIAVTGYDNIQNELKMPIRVTTVAYDKMQIADVAVEVIMHKIESAETTARPFRKIHDVELLTPPDVL